jgi:hypothetical protein
MHRIAAFSAVVAFSGSLLAAESNHKDEVLEASRKLAETSYTWRTTMDFPEGARFRPGPTEGKTEKGGPALMTMPLGDSIVQAAIAGDKAAMQTDEGWQTSSEMDTAPGSGRARAIMLRNTKLPADQAAELVAAAKSIQKDREVYSAELTQEGARTLMSYEFRARLGGVPTIHNPAGAVKFWISNGVLTKYAFDLKGSMTIKKDDLRLDRTTTVEITEVGATKVELPAGAKKKLGL